MNLLDIIIIIVMLFLIVRGIFRGFFMEIASLAGLVFGILISLRFYPQMTGVLRSHVPSLDDFVLQLISIAAIFVSILLLSNFIGWGFKTLSKKTFLGWADKGLGAGLAVLKGILITYLAIVILTFFVPSQAPLVARSKLAPLVIHSYQSIISVISPGAYENWKRKFIQQKEKVNKVISEKIEDLTE
jgi:membrane protein required for colicin V production